MTKIFNTTDEAFAYYTECALATVEALSMKRSTPKWEIDRAQVIAKGMVDHCKRVGFKPSKPFAYLSHPRLNEFLSAD